MSESRVYRIAGFAGDGIGPEVTEPCIEVLDAVTALAGGFRVVYEPLRAGADCFAATGESFEQGALERAGEADAILLGAMGMPDIRYEDGTEISPQLDLRETYGLFAGERPVITLPGLPLPLADPRAAQLDFVLLRESTEGLFARRGQAQRRGDDAVLDTLVITRRVSEALFDHAFRLARRRKAQGLPGKVTCVDKANVLESFAFFREIFLEKAASYPDIEADCMYVDAAGMTLVKAPWIFDVIVTENMFGDILSDIGAALMGGMGLAPSADIGEGRAVFQPCHGSAPDIVGQGKANPTAMILSGAMMLEWLGEQHDDPACTRAASMLRQAVHGIFASGEIRPFELGGQSGTRAIADAVLAALKPVRLGQVARR